MSCYIPLPLRRGVWLSHNTRRLTPFDCWIAASIILILFALLNFSFYCTVLICDATKSDIYHSAMSQLVLLLAYWVEHLASCRIMPTGRNYRSSLEIINSILIKNYMLEHVIFDEDFFKHQGFSQHLKSDLNFQTWNSDPAFILLMVGKLHQIASTFLFCYHFASTFSLKKM